MPLDLRKPSLKMRSVIAQCANASAGPKKDLAMQHLKAAKDAQRQGREALLDEKLDAAIRALS